MTDDARTWKEVVRRGYDSLSDLYRGDDDDPVEYRPWLEQLLVVLRPGSRVLDLGCGNGVPVARTLSAAGHSVTGIDISDRQIERARRLVPSAEFISADIAEWDFGAGCFDAVVALYSLIHLPLAEQQSVIDRAFAALVDDGVLVATVGWDAWTGSETGWLGGMAEMRWSQADHRTYQCWLEHAGFCVDTIELVPEGDSGHALFWAHRPPGPDSPGTPGR